MNKVTLGLLLFFASGITDIKSQEFALSTYGSDFYVGFSEHIFGALIHQFYIHTYKTTPVSFNITSLDGIFNYTGTCSHLNPAIVDIPFSYEVSGYDYSWRDKGLKISSVDVEPISVIGWSYRGEADFMAYLAYPCHKQPTTEYVYYAVSSLGFSDSKSEFLIVGCHDNSSVTIIPTGTITLPIDAQDMNSSTITLTAGQKHSLVLHSMQTLLIFASHIDLTASKILSNQPLTILSGHEASRVPFDISDADPIVTQVPPTIQWGTQFLLSPHIHSGRTGQNYRMIASMDNTVIVRKCGSDAMVNSTLHADQWLEFYTIGIIYCSVVSNNPIYVAQLGVSKNYNGGTFGDPSINTVAPMEQYLNSIQYTTLTASFHYVSVVLPNDEYYDGTVILDGILQNVSEWNTIYYSDGSIAGYGYSASTTGTHTIAHPNKQGKLFVTVYGWTAPGGYSYVGGMSLNPLVTNCELNNGGCEQNCINTLGSHFCTCNESYTLNVDNKTCQPNCINPCGNCFSCISIDQCECFDGWTGDKCCTDIDECEIDNGGCEQACHNMNGSFSCSCCNSGYIISDNHLDCDDIDECAADIDGCNHNCSNTNGSYVCFCYTGYKLHDNMKTCIDIDECEVDNGGCDHQCINTNGSFQCACNDGYELDMDLTSCNRPPYVIPSNGQFTFAITRNNSVTISVSITAVPPVNPSNIQWYFQSTLDELVELPNNTVKYTFSADRQSLTISDVQISDVGTYRITAANIAGTNETDVTLVVYVEAALLNTNGYFTEITSGQSITINCTADGINRPNITWRKDGQLILNTTRLRISSLNDMQGFRPIPGVQQITSSLTIRELRESDSGSYSCRADNEADVPVSLNSPFMLIVSVPTTPNPCLDSSCQNGQCNSLDDGYLCICDEGYTGRNCDIVVITFLSPNIEVHPVDTIVELYQSASLICIATGNPAPNILWYKDNVIFSNTNSDPSVLLFDEIDLDDRGFYRCEAENIINGRIESDVSIDVILNIIGVVQYDAVIELPSDFFENDRQKRQDVDQSQQITNLIIQINDYLSGGVLVNDVSFFVVEILNPENIDFSSLPQVIPIIITLVTEEGGSDELLRNVEEEIQTLGMQLNINITIDEVDRFDGCRSNTTEILSHSGNPNLTITIQWPETNIGELAEVDCPCGNVTSMEGNLRATRYCGGNFIDGGQWRTPNIASCNFSDLAREICALVELETEERLQSLDDITENVANLGSTEVIVSVAVLLTATEEVSGNLSLSNDFLNVVDNLINVDLDILQESQESFNTSAMILEAIEFVVDDIPIGNNSEPVVITRRSFAVSVQQVDFDQFMERGQTFSVNLGLFSDLNTTENINSNDLSFEMRDTQSTGSLSLPNNLFSAISNTGNDSRITHSVFLSDSLFLRRQNNNLEVGSLIISASIVGSTVDDLNPPITLSFLKNPIINGSDPCCSFWNPLLDDGFGDWSSEGCVIDERYNNTQDEVTCFCDHLTNFAILLDVSPEIEPTEETPSALLLNAVTYIGIIVSIICLLITVISYLGSTKLRTSEHGQLLINLCLALMGLYITFIFSIHSSTVTSLCALVAALLQYFFLVTFMMMASEAINLYMKLVVVLGAKIPHFVLKATVISWVTPIFIVLFCFAPNYENYVSDHFCRAFNAPYYIGMVVPFLIIYIFNWTIFFVIIVSLLRKSAVKKRDNISFVREQVVIVTTLSFLFGLGWGIGLFVTQDIHNSKVVQDLFAGLFVIFTAFHGFFTFIFQCLRSKDVRNLWKKWFFGATGKDFSEFTSSTFGRFRKYQENASHRDSTSDGGNLKQFYGQQGMLSPLSPGGDLRVAMFDESTPKVSGNIYTMTDSVGISSFPLEEMEKDDCEMEKETSNEEEATMINSSFVQTSIIVDNENDKQKDEQETAKKMENTSKEEVDFILTLEYVDEDTENEISDASSDNCDDPESNP